MAKLMVEKKKGEWIVCEKDGTFPYKTILEVRSHVLEWFNEQQEARRRR